MASCPTKVFDPAYVVPTPTWPPGSEKRPADSQAQPPPALPAVAPSYPSKHGLSGSWFATPSRAPPVPIPHCSMRKFARAAPGCLRVTRKPPARCGIGPPCVPGPRSRECHPFFPIAWQPVVSDPLAYCNGSQKALTCRKAHIEKPAILTIGALKIQVLSREDPRQPANSMRHEDRPRNPWTIFFLTPACFGVLVDSSYRAVPC